LLVGQSKHPDTNFEISDYSIKEHLSADWKAKARTRIKGCEVVIVICGEYTNLAAGVSAELAIAKEESVPIFLLWGRSGKACVRPTAAAAAATDKIYEWTWDTLKNLSMAQDDPQAETRKVLFSPDENRPAVDAAYLEQYKLYLGLVDSISERRHKANSFFLSINTGICALLGYFFPKDTAPELRSLFWLIPVAGIFLSYFWYRLVRSYRDLNSAKFRIIHLIEERLPLGSV
jgi:hypothetical protein